MTDGQTALLRLMAWLSPAFPVGSFSYSHGQETAVHAGLVEDAACLRDWLTDLVTRGSAWNDAVLVAEAHRQAAAGGDLDELAALGEALAGSRERHMETMSQGEAFLTAVEAWRFSLPSQPPPLTPPLKGEGDSETSAPPSPLRGGVRGGGDGAEPVRLSADTTPYPVAIGAVAGTHGVPLADTLAAYLHAFVSNQLQAAIRLSVLGQTEAVAALAALEPVVAQTAARAAMSSLDDIGSATMMGEIAAMQHETHYSRLFRT